MPRLPGLRGASSTRRHLSTVYLRRPGEITRVKLSTRQRMLPAARGVWGRFGSLEPQLTPVQSWETDGLRGAQGGDRRLFRGDRRLFRFGLTVQDGKIGEPFRAVARGGSGEVSGSRQSGSRQDPELSYEKQNDCEDRQILRPRIVYVYRVPCTLPR